MTPTFLILIVVAVFAALFAFETAGDSAQPRIKPFGLFSWLVSGNWPAKVGAGLVIVGVGALLRYAAINFDAPPAAKLAGGVVISAVLGAIAMAMRNRPDRRAIHLALAGSAFGVAYLTAYTAYGIFQYITAVNALALLALVAVAAGVFAVTSNAMSVAILAMVGAYIAPRFAIGTPGVLPVYGYYLAVSLLSLFMVTLRGWRPLIHLSFLFTLAGAVFFGWSARFYEPQHYALMQPMLLALSAVHLAMPLLEQRHARSTWLVRFDLGYFILLPLVAAMLTLKIAPTVQTDGALGLIGLAAIWAVAAGILFARKNPEAPRHAMVAVLLALGALLCVLDDVPWLLVALGAAVAALAAAPRLEWSNGKQESVAGMVLFFGALHIVNSITQSVSPPAFINELFAHRVIGSSLMILAGWIATRRAIAFAFGKILGVTGIGWALLALLAEVLRLHLDFLPQLCYGILLALILLTIVFTERAATHPILGGVLVFALVIVGRWAAHGANDAVVIAFFVLTPLVLLALAWDGRDTARKDASDFAPAMAIGLLPFALLPWASASADLAGIGTDFFELTIGMAGIAIAGLTARLYLRDSPRWNGRIQPLHVWFSALTLLAMTLFHIERGIWPVAFEILALAYLMRYFVRRSHESSPPGMLLGAVTVVSAALVLQAMLLRAFGPGGVMTAWDINKMHLPAVVSLMWTVFGAGLAWWATRMQSRRLWSAGAVLLIAAAVKLVLFDFGDLGQLGNILAFIAAGVVFLGVAWLAPIPNKSDEAEAGASLPAPEQSSRPSTSSGSRYRDEPESQNWLWIMLLGFAIVIAVLSSAWKKHEKRQRVMQEYRQQHAASVPQAPVLTQPLPLAEQPAREAPAVQAPAAPPPARPAE